VKQRICYVEAQVFMLLGLAQSFSARGPTLEFLNYGKVAENLCVVKSDGCLTRGKIGPFQRGWSDALCKTIDSWLTRQEGGGER